MIEPGSEGGSPASAASPGDDERIDTGRLRSFLGLSIGLVGPRANLAVSGVLITLYVQQRAHSALAVTFALTANRLISIVAYPLVGRESDRTKSLIGRRTPYLGGSLVIMGFATWCITLSRGYWTLVVAILVVRLGAAVFALANAVVVPEVFGRSRWLKALFLSTVLGTIASLFIKATVVTSWKQSNPATWNLPFQAAAVIMAVAGVIILLTVRESAAAAVGASRDRAAPRASFFGEFGKVLRQPNAPVLVAGSLLFWSGVGSTSYVAILFFQRVLHAGASAQTVAGLVSGLPALLVGAVLGIPLSRVVPRRAIAVGGPIAAGLLLGSQYFATALWQAVGITFLVTPIVGAYLIAFAPMLLQLLPSEGGFAERLGVLLGPFNFVGVLMAYLAAAIVDATGNYRLIWLVPLVTAVAQGVLNCWLKIPERRRDAGADPVARVWAWANGEADRIAEVGLVKGLLAAPLIGQITAEDADSSAIVDLARSLLGDPYASEPAGTAEPDGEAGPIADPASGRPDGAAGDLAEDGDDPIGGAPTGDRVDGPG